MTTGDADTDQPVTMARMADAELLRQMRELGGTLAATADRLTGAVATMADPTAAEVEAARAAAEQRAAAAEAGRAEAERRASIVGQMRADTDDAAEEEEQARQAHDRLADATAAHTAEAERIRREAQEPIAAAEADRDYAVEAAEAARDATVTDAAERRQEAQRAAVAEAAETTWVRDDAARELEQLRAVRPPSWTGSAPKPPASGTTPRAPRRPARTLYRGTRRAAPPRAAGRRRPRRRTCRTDPATLQVRNQRRPQRAQAAPRRPISGKLSRSAPSPHSMMTRATTSTSLSDPRSRTGRTSGCGRSPRRCG